MITLPASIALLLILLSIYGLFISAIVFTVAAVSLVQRRMMHSEVKRYVQLLELANANMQQLVDVKSSPQVVRIDGSDMHLGEMMRRAG